MTESAKLLKALTQMDYSKRADKVRSKMPDELDAIVVSHLTNVRYITGYTGSNGLVLLTRDSMMFITDGRYKIQSKEQLEAGGVNAEICVTSQGEGPFSFLEKAITSNMKIGLEASTLSWESANRYIENFSTAEFVPTSEIYNH